MDYLWSAKTGGFYVRAIHGDNIPDDAIKLTGYEYDELRRQHESGRPIVVGAKGMPAAKAQAEVMIDHFKIAEMVKARIQKRIDDLAESWDYSSILSAATYLGSTVPQFRAEAEALMAYRDAMWLWAMSLGKADPMSMSEFNAQIDALMAQAPAQPNRPMVE